MNDLQLIGPLLTFVGVVITAILTNKAAKDRVSSNESVAYAQERTKLLVYYEKQLEKSNQVIEAQSEQLKIYKKQTEDFQIQIVSLEKSIRELTQERDELRSLIQKIKEGGETYEQ